MPLGLPRVRTYLPVVASMLGLASVARAGIDISIFPEWCFPLGQATCGWTNDPVPKSYCQLESADSVACRLVFPDGARGACKDSSNDGDPCDEHSDCLGGGSARCAVDIAILAKVRTAETDTDKNLCVQTYMESTTEGGNWGANDGDSGTPGAGDIGMSSAKDTPNVEIFVNVPVIEAINGTTLEYCSPVSCAWASTIMVIERPTDASCPNASSMPWQLTGAIARFP